LAVITYKLFSNVKDYGFKDQIQRCAVSISNNIAEWFERESNKDFKRFLYIAKWSNWEFRNMLYIWNELWYITKKDFSKLYNLSVEISKMIWWYIKRIKDNK